MLVIALCKVTQCFVSPTEKGADMIKNGTWVGAARWPNKDDHPDRWPKPIGGQVIDFCDVRAWANTIYFPTSMPNAGDVMGVALKLQAQGMLAGLTPVLWDFLTHRVVCWERTSGLKLYTDDLLLWRAAKAQRLDQIQHPRRRKPRSLRDFLPENLQHLVLA
jgi:hypothetical protein